MNQPPLEARVAIFSPREFHHHVSRSHGYEFEDIIVSELDNVDFFAPKAGRFHPLLNKVKNRLSYRTEKARSIPIGLEKMSCERDYDLFFYTVAHPRNVNLLSSLKNWRSRSKTAICWIQELWLYDFNRLGTLLDRLNEFDFVVCSFVHTAEALNKRLKTPVLYIPWGIDMVHFCPYPNPPKRVIDVLSIGARHDSTHKALIDYTDNNGRFYSYETISGRAEMRNHREHRHNFVSQIQRSRYFFSHIAKIKFGDRREAQVEFGLRYIEGLAAGATVLGTRIESEAFAKYLGWEDSVIDIPYECPDIGAVLKDLDAQPDRLELIRKRNIIECLERHDHLYRWEKILELADMPETREMALRRNKLHQLIRVVKQDKPQFKATK